MSRSLSSADDSSNLGRKVMHPFIFKCLRSVVDP